jgi:hypothetical protein
LENDYLAIAVAVRDAPTPDPRDRRLVEVPPSLAGFFWQVEMDPCVFAFVCESSSLREGAVRDEDFRVFVSRRHAAIPKAQSSGRKGSVRRMGLAQMV